MFPAGGDMSGLLAQAQALQEQMQRAQEELREMECVGTAGGGLVQATLAGDGALKRVDIKPEACDPEDTETLGDLIVAAVQDGMRQVQVATQAKLGPMAGGMDLGELGLPGFGN